MKTRPSYTFQHLYPLEGEDKEQGKIHHEKDTNIEARRKAWDGHI